MTRLTIGRTGVQTMFEWDFSSNAEALVAILLVAAITVIAFV
jgi:hypothetical protein